MGTLKQLCKPRPSVFDRTRRDVVLDLTDLVEDRIDPIEFFCENHPTEGMKRLLREAFRRFEGQAGNGVVKLTQAMGGGKTHSMIALGLLAKHPELRKQVMGDLFLSGQRKTLETLLEVAREYKAISHILEELDKEKIPDSDPRRATAIDLFDKVKLRLLSATRETFTRLTYPHGDQLMNADFLMNFTSNEYRGEQQVRETLKGKQRFTEDVTGDTFRKKCEARLFTQKAMPWAEVRRRAAMNTSWQWHRPDALDLLKEDLCHKDQWREEGGYVEKGPFPLPTTDVRIQELDRNSDTGEVTLKLTPVHGDAIHYEVGAPATSGSLKVADAKCFRTKGLEVSFLCADSGGGHEAGDAVTWRNRITVKSRAYQNGQDKMLELRAAPPVPLRYTTDGSDPKLHGGAYDGPLVIPNGTVCVLALAEKNGLSSDVHRLDIDWSSASEFKVDPDHPAVWRREHSPKTTKETYDFLARLRKHAGEVPGPRVSIVGQAWLELSFDEKLVLSSLCPGARRGGREPSHPD